MDRCPYGKTMHLDGVGQDEAIERVEAALAEEGFGVLTRIDVTETLREKLDATFRPYVILGACSPELAHKALLADGHIGLLLPCNVVVQQENGGALVSTLDPRIMAEQSNAPPVEKVAAEAEERLDRMLASL